MHVTRNSLKQTINGDNIDITEKHDKCKAYVLPKAVSFWLVLISPQKAMKCDYLSINTHSMYTIKSEPSVNNGH